jgi:hypothetical protein
MVASLAEKISGLIVDTSSSPRTGGALGLGAGRLRPRFQQRDLEPRVGRKERGNYVRAIAIAERPAPTAVGSGDLLGGIVTVSPK